jgi:hypothetical protein
MDNVQKTNNGRKEVPEKYLNKLTDKEYVHKASEGTDRLVKTCILEVF